jgi:hypothetical protein
MSISKYDRYSENRYDALNQKIALLFVTYCITCILAVCCCLTFCYYGSLKLHNKDIKSLSLSLSPYIYIYIYIWSRFYGVTVDGVFGW